MGRRCIEDHEAFRVSYQALVEACQAAGVRSPRADHVIPRPSDCSEGIHRLLVDDQVVGAWVSPALAGMPVSDDERLLPEGWWIDGHHCQTVGDAVEAIVSAAARRGVSSFMAD